ncbi:MAG: amino acid ABC transporter permease [Sphingomonadaceae bacterium]|nr:amino acid ABC transporter permease [Sphingomonadaceae bacterium]
MLLLVIPRLLSWAVVHGVWQGGPAACRAAEGACWAFLRAKAPQILLGIYPPDERWRAIAAVAIIVALALWTLPPSHWSRRTLWLWLGGIVLALLLMGGTLLGLQPVPTSAWGGLPITLLLTVLSLAIGFPVAVALALGRRSRAPILRWMSIAFIEVVRGLPLLSMLFIAAVMLPIMLPESFSIDNLTRALVALSFYAAAYLAEVLRGGLQAIPPGQEEAASALGLRRWQVLRLVVLPQAIGKVVPALTNTVVVIVKNTSLVLVVGIFDLLSSGRAALADPDWPAPFAETFGLVALVYFVICFGISRYSLFLEARMNMGNAR